ncbi:MAG TPA: fimbria/pilus periplasmic chaperone [Allosphingosinicella sp.]|nr:fimbria/pilus periplasmic chaperone [Allosphingosinicella sp.]
MRRFIPLAACAALALSAAAGLPPAAAGTLQVNPVLVEIGGARRTGSVTVRNEEDVPVTIRAHPLAWRQDGGEDIYEETAELIVSPPVFTIPPHATQTVRVGARRPSPAPRSYRLIIEEVPEAAPASAGIRVALRLNLPLYANLAAGAPADLAWRAARRADGQWAIEARNNGAGWVRVEQPLAEAATGLRLENGFSFGTVLPGSTRRWLVGAAPRIGDRARFEQISRIADHGATSPPQHDR